MSFITPRKRPRNDENAGLSCTPRTPRDLFRTPFNSRPLNFNVVSTPVISSTTRKKRLVAREISAEEHERLKLEYAQKMKEVEEAERMAVEKLQRDEKTSRINNAMQAIRAAGFSTFHGFLEDVLTAQDAAQSSHISQLIINHGSRLLDHARQRQPQIIDDWIISSHRQLISSQCAALAAYFCPRRLSSVTEILAGFSLKGFLEDAERVAPLICQVLRQVGFPESVDDPKFKNRELILATTICMLAKSRNEHATEFQTTMCMYFLACGTQRSLFDVLNHAGITLSYTQAIYKLKKLGEERLEQMREIARTRAFMILWDNLNVAFEVSQQRQDSKSHFDNGTTATLVPLFDVAYGSLPTSLKPPRLRNSPELKFEAEDLLPSYEEATRVQEGQIWHIMDILYDAYPDLQKRFGESIPPPTPVMQIPIHTTEQYPIPAMAIDESTLEGTLHVFSTIFSKSLKLSEDDMKRHGIVLCAGDQLSMSLLDKVSAIRRDDTNFMDNIGQYTEGQDGLLHIKFSHTRMIANEYWGKPNSKSPWSLWKINTLLGRKAISAGWTAKSPPPFRPLYELILDLTLPANILDAFRIHCPTEELDDWVKGLKSHGEVKTIARKVHDKLCSGHYVQRQRREPPKKRDVPNENIILFNRDALHLRQLKYAIKRGDVGAVLDLITHLMLAFRGTGKTPKYADALFHIVVNLKRMDSQLRYAWLVNWLANLSGKQNGFKEMDLLQEHQNFWLKIIYNAKGANRSWDWLGMVSVSIFALRDVIRKVRKEFITPFNSSAHTNPSTLTDIKIICDYLRAQLIQEFSLRRENNDSATEARDLIQGGSDYANKPSAFRNFKYSKFKTTNHGVQMNVDNDGNSGDEHEEDENDLESSNIDAGSDIRTELADLLLDEDEYPDGADADEYLNMFNDIINELN